MQMVNYRKYGCKSCLDYSHGKCPHKVCPYKAELEQYNSFLEYEFKEYECDNKKLNIEGATETKDHNVLQNKRLRVLLSLEVDNRIKNGGKHE